MRVAVLMGGSSEERGVSLASGCQVSKALRSLGHEVVGVDAAVGAMPLELEERVLAAEIGEADVPGSWPAEGGPDRLPEARVLPSEPALRNVDVVFIAMHGGAGEDGRVQTLLDFAGVPYAGTRPVGCALAMDKDLTKRLLRDEGVATPHWLVGETAAAEVVDRLGLPTIVKPLSGGSSVRLTLAQDEDTLDVATQDALGGGDQVMYEAYIEGREFTVGVLADQALPVVEIIPNHELFDFECKYRDGMAQEIAPAQIDDALAWELQDTALRVHRLLRLSHFSRVDFMVDGDGRAFCLEANALPGLTANSLLPKAAMALEIGFPELCERICRLGIRGTCGTSVQ